MTGIFLTVLNMSVTASIVILVVLFCRLLLKRSPRIYSYLLWIVVLVRLVCPVAISTGFGIIPEIELVAAPESEQQYIAEDSYNQSIQILDDTQRSEADIQSELLWMQSDPQDMKTDAAYLDMEALSLPFSDADIQRGAERGILQVVDAFFDSISDSMWQIVAGIWLAGCVTLSVYGIISYRRLLRKLSDIKSEQTLVDGYEDERILFSDKIETPFTAGFLEPMIYLPDELTGRDLEMVIEHEKTHIRRRDYLVKTVAFFIACIHWFNPLVWLSFHLMEADMETSCDEAVLKKIGYDRKKAYARTLLTMSQEHAIEIGRCPLSFGENNVKSRIRNVVRLKKVKAWIAVASAVLVLGAVMLLLVNHEEDASENIEESAQTDESVEENRETLGESVENDETDIETWEECEEIQDANDVAGMENTQIDSLTYGEVCGEEGDIYSVLLQNPLGVYTQERSLYTYPVYGTVEAATYGEKEATTITSVYGTRVHPITGTTKVHTGIDFGAGLDTPVHAAAEGVVLETGMDTNCGNYVILFHLNGELTYYAHCNRILVEKGQIVIRGEEIATVGNTGASTGEHLHFAVSRNGAFVEPEFVKDADQIVREVHDAWQQYDEEVWLKEPLYTEEHWTGTGELYGVVDSAQFESVAQIRELTESIFTQTCAQENFYQYYLDGENPIYYEKEGQLRRSAATFMGRHMPIYSIEIVGTTQDTIVAKVVEYNASDSQDDSGRGHVIELHLLKQGDTWKISYYLDNSRYLS